MSQEVKIERVNWLPWIVLIVILAIVSNIVVALMGLVERGFCCIYTVGMSSRLFEVEMLPPFLLLLSYPLIRRIKMSRISLARLYTIGLVMSGILGMYDAWTYIPVGWHRMVYNSSPEIRNILLNVWWSPPVSAIEAVIRGGVTPNYADWLSSILFWLSFYLICFAFTSNVMGLLRHIWIDLEKVPFPYTLATYGILERVEQGLSKVRGRTAFIIGIAAGFVLQFQVMMTYLFPWWPDLLSWRSPGASIHGCVCVRSGDIIGSTLAGWSSYNIQPLHYALAYLAPLDMLFTVWLMQIIILIATQAAWYGGYYSGIFDLGGFCRAAGWGGFERSITWGPPFYWGWMSHVGGMLALVFMIFWRFRSYIADTIRAIKTGEYVEREAMSYRAIYTMIAVSAILLILFFTVAAGTSIVSAFILLIFLTFIYTIADMYAYGLMGITFLETRVLWSSWPFRLIWPRAPETYTQNWLMSISFMHRGVNLPGNGVFCGALMTIRGFKLADLAGAKPRDIYKFICITFLVALPISFIMRIYFINLFGATRTWSGCGNWDCAYTGRSAYNTAPPLEWIGIGGVAGFIVVLAISFLRGIYAWFPIHPLGFILATGIFSSFAGSWSIALGAWIAKWLTLKIGGSRAYEEYGMPFVSGYVTGFIIDVILGIIVQITRIFIPF
ncbi:OPT/YSL family transporter [Candidatus Bathyarchaeota archaeon]|nr:OPT/YSL family transporter [Candidatus Bathyarchaeota archaeon]